jgi:hypothetical protein
MGYTTEFTGKFKLNKKLSPQMSMKLKHFADERHDPKDMPDYWCNWVPTYDDMGIVWNGAEKFYNYIGWLQYLIDNFLQPQGYQLSGDVEWEGESFDDTGTISVHNNVILAKKDIAYKIHILYEPSYLTHVSFSVSKRHMSKVSLSELIEDHYGHYGMNNSDTSFSYMNIR